MSARWRGVARVAGGVLLVCGLVACGLGASRLAGTARSEADMRAVLAGKMEAVGPGAPGPVQAARGLVLVAHGAFDDAQAIADRMAGGPDPGARATLLMALGNARLEQAMALFPTAPFRKVKPMIVLARSAYREVLRIDPGNWAARYNFAYAAELLPDREQYVRSSGAQMSHDEALWPDVPGAPNGMP